MPLAEWARRVGLSKRTAQRQAQQGELPVPFRVDTKGRYVVVVDSEEFPTALTPEEMTELLLRIERKIDRIERKIG